MDRAEITEKLRGILIAADGRAAGSVMGYTEDSKLTEDIGLSSVTMLYLVIAIEEEFGIRFDDVGAGDFVTLGDVIDRVEAKLG